MGALNKHYDALAIQKHLMLEHGVELDTEDIIVSYSTFCESTWCAGWMYPTRREMDDYYRWLCASNHPSILESLNLCETLNSIGAF